MSGCNGCCREGTTTCKSVVGNRKTNGMSVDSVESDVSVLVRVEVIRDTSTRLFVMSTYLTAVCAGGGGTLAGG